MQYDPSIEINPDCSLFPYEITEIVSVQDAEQKAGWSINAFDLPGLWMYSQGEGVKVAVLDCGCDLNHPDLVANLLPGINFVQPGKPPMDDVRHGTHVSGIIAAANNEIGVVGVAPKAKIIPIKVLDRNGNGNLANVSKGIFAAIEMGADIITMSLGSPNPLPELLRSIQFAASKGVPIFVAAGNAGNTKEVFYPAAYRETIAVGAIDESFKRASFSNTGRNLDFMAPGVNIMSTVPPNWYALMSGTSMAAPFVAGIAALFLSSKKAKGQKVSGIETYREEFRKRCFPISGDNAGDHFFQGFGIISAKDLEL